MSQSPNPQPPKTPWGKRTEKVMENILEPLELIGQRLLGSLWKTLYESVQDAITLSLLLQIPSLIGRLILGKDFSSYDVCLQENPLGSSRYLGKDFSSYDVCLQENPLGSSRYACFIIVTSDFLLWIILAGRILSRFWIDFNSLWKKGGTKRGSR